ncbi:NAD(P)H-dependent oxidoreductase [Leadbettera azotonutricia]|uniref:Ribosyldihydronicotinamide dehydrogenase [quinone] (NRHdehydrogenase [quinone] 2) (Quinone reductase 2) (QR2) (NRH:quinoneoxidoreductase 2) n=1 Tax=Leadbettera azotonutricia (strain ATCC BAA-888 / DSM 13862 / ZAS-9) TaxID=545695 RepID=F5YE29_LEAAZ|nr:NAD(P)H-dependent oxidoreductase [Leadbettera azotonutricia]AEF81294.1 ribosyldihydronicotinamide dehydrogenase [quinone] (NRHdehydrogenase [quinone] 2) (Quinone reductase 2) (QR2) (NRH:quinoneoxidoreductase 2) [Leadbettera azotonutricia ZAS-9]
MRIFIVYAHPSEDSFTRHIRDHFIRGVESAGHSYILSDLYKMNFKTDMNEAEYLREAFYSLDTPVPDDVLAEQNKINASDAIVFIYPVFWSDVPAKLKGWFDRVWTYGFAYGLNRSMKQLEKALVMVSAGNNSEYFDRTGLLDAMKKVILNDRLFDRVKTKEMIVFDSTSRELPERKFNWDKHLRRAFETGAKFWQ